MEVSGRGGKGRVLKSLLRRVRFVLVAPAVVQLHPVVLSILDLPSVLQSLGKQVPEVIVVGGVFKTKIAHITQIFGEFF